VLLQQHNAGRTITSRIMQITTQKDLTDKGASPAEPVVTRIIPHYDPHHCSLDSETIPLEVIKHFLN